MKRALVAAISITCLTTVVAQTPSAADAIIKADRDFNQAVMDRNMKRFLSFIVEGATFGGGTPSEIRGHDAIEREWSQYFQPNGTRLIWTPTKAEVLGKGDLGYSVGSWERRVPGAGGQTTTSRGNYLTVWAKQADGSWKVVYDTGSSF